MLMRAIHPLHTSSSVARGFSVGSGNIANAKTTTRSRCSVAPACVFTIIYTAKATQRHTTVVLFGTVAVVAYASRCVCNYVCYAIICMWLCYMSTLCVYASGNIEYIMRSFTQWVLGDESKRRAGCRLALALVVAMQIELFIRLVWECVEAAGSLAVASCWLCACIVASICGRRRLCTLSEYFVCRGVQYIYTYINNMYVCI